MFLYDQEQYDAPASVKEISNYIAKKTGLGDPGKDTETGKNIGVEGNNGGGQTGGKSEQPAAAPAQTEAAANENTEAAEESSEAAEETIESSAEEETKAAETSSGVINAPQAHPDSSETAASDHTNNGPGSSAGPGASTNGPGTSSAPTAAETNGFAGSTWTKLRQWDRRSRTRSIKMNQNK